MQRTNVALNEKLVREGMRLFKKKTKKELIDFALREIIRREKAKGILALEGKVSWEGDLQEMRKERFADLGQARKRLPQGAAPSSRLSTAATLGLMS